MFINEKMIMQIMNIRLGGNQTISRNFLFSTVVTLIIGIVNMLYPLVVGLFNDVEIMGDFTILIFWSVILSIPIQNGLSPALSRFIAASDEDDEQPLKSLSLKISAIYLLIVFMSFPFLGYYLFIIDLLEVFVIIALFSVSIFHYLFRNMLLGQEKFKQLFLIEIVSLVIFLMFAVFFGILPGILNWSHLERDYYFCIPIIAYHFTFNALFLLFIYRKFTFRKFFKFPSITKNILKYSFLIGFGSILGLGINKLQIIISEKYLSSFEVGVLSFWNYAIAPLLLLSIALGAILLPRVSNLHKYKYDLINPFINKTNWAVSLFITPLLGSILLLIAIFPNLLAFSALSKYQSNIYWPIIILLGLQATTSLLSTPTMAYFSSSEKKVIFNLLISLIYTISIIISWVLLIPNYGIFGFAIGIAIGGLTSSISTQIIALIVTKGKIGLHILFEILIYCFFGLNIYLIKYWLYLPIILWFVFSFPVFIIGIRLFISILTKKDYSIRYKNLEV